MADDRLYGQKVYDGGIAADELGRFNPRLAGFKKVSDNEVLWTFDNCKVTVTAEGSGDERHGFKMKVEEITE